METAIFNIDFRLKNAIADLQKTRVEFAGVNAEYKKQVAASESAEAQTKQLTAANRTLVGIEQQLVNQNVLLLTSFNKLATATDKAEKSAESAKGSFISLGSAFQQAAGFAAGLGVVTGIEGFFSEIVRGTAEAEKQLAVLQNALGEVEGKAKFEELKGFAETTNFSFEEATGAVLKFLGQGVNPTIQQLTSLADVANAQGKSLDQLTEAILDARSGENERLKEFGIKAKTENDKVSFSFKGVTTTVAKTDAAISEYLFGLGQLPGVSGTTAKISKTLGGELSNLGDQFTAGAVEIGKTFRGALSGAIQGIAALIKGIVAASKWLANNTGVVKGLALAYAGLKLNTIVATFTALGTSIAKATGITTLWTAAQRYSTVATAQNATVTAADTVATNVNTAAKERATVTVRGLWLALKANPLGAIIVLLGAAYAAYQLLSNSISETARAEKEFADTLRSVDAEIYAQRAAAESLFNEIDSINDAIVENTKVVDNNKTANAQLAGALLSANELRNQQRFAIERVIDEYGKYLTQQEIEELRLGKIDVARAKVIAGLEKEIKLRGLQAAQQQIIEKLGKVINERSDAIRSLGSADLGSFSDLLSGDSGAPFLARLSAFLNTTPAGLAGASGFVADRIKELNALAETYKQQLKSLGETLLDLGGEKPAETPLTPIVDGSKKDADKLKKLLEDLAGDIKKFADSGRKAFELAGVDSITMPLTRDLQGALLSIKGAIGEFEALKTRLAEALALGADPALAATLETGLRDFLTALVIDTKNNVVKAIGTASPDLIASFDALADGLKTGPLKEIGSLFDTLSDFVAKADEIAIALKSVSAITKAVVQAGVGAIAAQKKALEDLTKSVEKFKERSDKALQDAKLNSIADPVERETAKLLAAFNEIKKGSDELKAKLMALPEDVSAPLLAALKKAGRQDIETLVRDFEQVILDSAPNVSKKVKMMLGDLVAAVSDGNTLPLTEVQAQMEAIIKLANTTGNSVKDIILRYADGVKAVTSEVFSLLKTINDAQQAAADREVEIQRNKLNALTAVNSQASAEQVAAEEARLEALLKKQRAFVEQQRNLATTQLILESSIAVAKAAAQGGVAAPFTIAATLIALAAGLATIRSQAQAATATAATGGIVGEGNLASTVSKGGILTGKRHSQGGQLIEAEGGEGILSRAAMARLGRRNFYQLNKYGRLAPDLLNITQHPVVHTMQTDIDGLKRAVDNLTFVVSAMPATKVVIDERGVAAIASRQNDQLQRINRYAE